ncbi:DNA glycosylase [Paxillus ammoniavirescens]|nr:DNA glycosylase [Paxillus ammoniavirescens]
MPETRSSAKRASAALPQTPAPMITKRKAVSAAASTTPRSKRSKSSDQISTRESNTATLGQVPLDRQEEEPLVPAVLNFSFEAAKTHLINIDSRFAELFARLRCKPFEFLEQVHPFRSLVVSILGQQISWLAARSINHRFIRLYDPSLPEKPNDYLHIKSPISFFPTPYQVANTEIATLKTAGLSTRKAEYVKDLAARFADGRLSTSKLLAAEDGELAEMLIEVRGIGRWTVDMFALFTLRRPNVLPVGDLGVQRGMLRWFGRTSFAIKPEKGEGDEDARKANGGTEGSDPTGVPKAKGNVPGPATPMGPPLTTPTRTQAVDVEDDTETGVADKANTLPTFAFDDAPEGETHLMDSAVPGDVSSVPPSSLLQTPHPSASTITSTTCELLPIPSLPQPFTPSINKVIEGGNGKNGNLTPRTKSLPEGLTQAMLKSRLDGKKVKSAFLAPQEMEALAQEWVPYRSLAVYYMWALAEEK